MIAYRNWGMKGQLFYVSNLPGDGGADWGYTTNPKKALVLTPYWVARFNKDCQRVGAKAIFAAA